MKVKSFFSEKFKSENELNELNELILLDKLE